MKVQISVLSAALALAAGSNAGEVARFATEQDQVLVTYQAALGRQQLSGVSRALAGAVEELPGAGLRVVAHVPASSFESGSPAVDALFRHALEAERYSTIDFEGSASLGKRTGQFTVQLEGTLSLHGVSQRLAVPVKVLRDGKTLFVKTAFPIDLAAFGLQPPSVLGRTVSPRVQIELFALLRPERSTAAAPTN